jgi:hypothetical protein
MSKEITINNYRVVVEPVTHVYGIKLSADTIKRDCQEIANQIKRHVDNIEHISVEFDTKITCSHCGYEWEVDETGLPQCCTKAQVEFEQQNQINEHS